MLALLLVLALIACDQGDAATPTPDINATVAATVASTIAAVPPPTATPTPIPASPTPEPTGTVTATVPPSYGNACSHSRESNARADWNCHRYGSSILRQRLLPFPRVQRQSRLGLSPLRFLHLRQRLLPFPRVQRQSRLGLSPILKSTSVATLVGKKFSTLSPPPSSHASATLWMASHWSRHWTD